MIFYFSGTGNSQWVAETLAKLTGDNAVSIPSLNKAGKTDFHIDDGGTVCFVFPVYAWAPPALVMEFAERITAGENVFRCAVCTCGDEAGDAMQKLQQKFAVDSAWSIAMPNNYILSFDVDSDALAREKVRNAAERLPLIADDIRERRKVWEVFRGRFPGIKTAAVAPLFNRFALGTKGFLASDACTSCGLCAENCPTGTISLKDGKPVWRGNCQKCLSCIHRCPVRAIQYGSSTQRKGRYVFSAQLLN